MRGPACRRPGGVALAKTKAKEPELTELLGAIAHDSGALIGQQLELLRAEVGQELRRVAGAATSVGAGAALVAVGGALGSLMLVHGLHRATRLSLWGCYGLVGALLGGAGAYLLAEGRREAGDVAFVPQTRQALRENLAWARDRLS
jgi:hypothetical protein